MTTEKDHPDRQADGNQAEPGALGSGEALCPECSGSGKMEGKTCPTCEGTGKVVGGIGGG